MLSTVAIAFGMSADAFAVALGKGAARGCEPPRIAEAMRIAAVFAAVETLAPLLGWALGLAASGAVAAVDHWIAFALLGGVGAKMCMEAARPPHERVARRGYGGARLVLTAMGTSVDAMAVGVSLALVGADVLPVAVAIGLATFVMATGGILMGRIAGAALGRAAEAAGGVLLIAIGLRIVIVHLGA